MYARRSAATARVRTSPPRPTNRGIAPGRSPRPLPSTPGGSAPRSGGLASPGTSPRARRDPGRAASRSVAPSSLRSPPHRACAARGTRVRSRLCRAVGPRRTPRGSATASPSCLQGRADVGRAEGPKARCRVPPAQRPSPQGRRRPLGARTAACAPSVGCRKMSRRTAGERRPVRTRGSAAHAAQPTQRRVPRPPAGAPASSPRGARGRAD